MPSTLESALESAKDATYTVVGLNLLVLDRIGERFEDQFSQLDKQLDIARKHAKGYESKLSSQYADVSERVQQRLTSVRSALPTRSASSETGSDDTSTDEAVPKKAATKKSA